MGQSQCLPDLRAPRHQDRARTQARRLGAVCVCASIKRVSDSTASTLTPSQSLPWRATRISQENLQKEIENETGIRFGVVEKHQFAAISVADPDGKRNPLGFDDSKEIWEFLKAEGYIDRKGRDTGFAPHSAQGGYLCRSRKFRQATGRDH